MDGELIRVEFEIEMLDYDLLHELCQKHNRSPNQQIRSLIRHAARITHDPRVGLRKGTVTQPDGSGFQGYIIDYRHDGIRWVAIVEYADGTLDVVSIDRVQLTDFRKGHELFY